MSYRSSRARRAFEAQLTSSLQELRPLHRAALKAGSGGSARLLAAYYVFAFAQFEVYVKSFVEDSLNAVATVSPPFGKWPPLMAAYLVHKGQDLGGEYRRFGTTEDEGALLHKLGDVATKLGEWVTKGTQPVVINPAEFLERKKYPSPRNLPQLFKRIGIEQVWAPISASGRMNSELILTSLNDLRTGIAHEGKVPPGFGYRDFRDRIDQMQRFVAALDRGISKQFCGSVMSRAQWNVAMT